MIRRLSRTCFWAICLMPLQALPTSGNALTQVLHFGSNIHAISINGPMGIVINHGRPQGSVSIQGTAMQRAQVQTEIKQSQGTLVISNPADATQAQLTHDVLVQVNIPELKALTLSQSPGGCYLRFNHGDSLTLSLHNATLIARGNVSQLTLNTQGKSQFNGAYLIAQGVVANVADRSEVTLQAHQNLVAHVTGASHLQYIGEPTLVVNEAHHGQVVPIPSHDNPYQPIKMTPKTVEMYKHALKKMQQS